MIGDDIELSPSINKALDAQDVKVELSSADNAADTFSIEYTDYLHTAVEFNKQLKYITYTIFTKDKVDDEQQKATIDPFRIMMSSGILTQKAHLINIVTNKDKLHNKIYEMLNSASCYFPKSMAQDDIKKQIAVISGANMVFRRQSL